MLNWSVILMAIGRVCKPTECVRVGKAEIIEIVLLHHFIILAAVHHRKSGIFIGLKCGGDFVVIYLTRDVPPLSEVKKYGVFFSCLLCSKMPVKISRIATKNTPTFIYVRFRLSTILRATGIQIKSFFQHFSLKRKFIPMEKHYSNA